jgi:hypothetical protein
MKRSVLAILGSCLLLSSAYAATENYDVSMKFKPVSLVYLDVLSVDQQMALCEKIKQDISEISKSSKFSCLDTGDSSPRFQIEMARDTLTIVDSQESNEALKTVSWKVNTSDQMEREVLVRKLVRRYMNAKKHERALKEFVLSTNISQSQAISLNDKFEYVETQSGKVISLEQAEQAFVNESAKNKNFMQATLNMALVLGSGQIWYWSNKDFNAVDWEYGFDWESYRQKLVTFEAVKFDSNEFETNSMAHPFAGAWYHLGARASGYNMYESFLFGFGSSLVWEYVGEFKEKVSINDIVITPVAGAVLGESIHKLSQFFLTSKNNHVNTVVGSLVDPVATFNNLFINRRPEESKNLDDLGFNADFFYNLEFYYGQEMNGGKQYVGFDTRLVDLKGYNDKGRFSKTYGQATETELDLRAVIGDDGIHTIKIFSKAALMGYAKQNITEVNGEKNGYSVLVGLSSAYAHNENEYPNGYIDKMGVINIIGTTIEVNAFVNGFHVRYNLDAYGDFTQINSVAVNQLEASGYELEQTKAVLQHKRYYFAYGATINNEAEISYKRLSLRADHTYQFANSIQGLDRYQEDIQDDFALTDHRSTLNVEADLRLFRFLSLSTGIEQHNAWGTAKGASESLQRRQYFGKVKISF